MGSKDVREKSKRKHTSRKGGRTRRTKGRKGLTFGFLMLILFILAGMGVFMVAMHQGALSSDLSAARIEQKISLEKTKQKSLRMSLARLKAPGRVIRVAMDDLGFTDPTAVIYLKYTKDSNGNIVCQSNYESTVQESTQDTSQEQTSPEQTPVVSKKQASIKTEISPNVTRR